MSQEKTASESERAWSIRGQSPKFHWILNPSGQSRTIDEAVAIARQCGVVVPDDVEFFADECGYCDEKTFARGPRVLPRPLESPVHWRELVHELTGKVPFLVRPDVLKSDEAIIAVFAHEMHELHILRPMLTEGKTSIEEISNLTRPGTAGNLHDRAWDAADMLVAQMRKERS